MPLSKKTCCPENKHLPHLKNLDDDIADEDLAHYAKALAHPARIKILRILISHNSCVCGEIVDQISLAQSTVSQHLKVLKESGLIKGEIEGSNTCYCIDQNILKKFKILISAL